ncbi:YsnF/AvaK domain-containing protein [Falsirhodobacter sp. 1013]|uniref:YsnF/AvaK domain-containing protein n=1 Tax=Falsirhodobacter sp. 1013 TaxID=3417566 RepID=UPI003EBA87A2
MTYNSDIDLTGNTTISSLFDSRNDAEQAVERLREVGIASSQIRVEGGSETAGVAGDTDANKGFWDKLGDYFFPDEDRYSYAEGLSRGGYLVTVTGLTTAEYDAALTILEDEGTVNMDEREESWRSEGWGGYASSSYATAGTAPVAATPAADRLTDDATIPVVEERLHVGKRDTSRGHVRVRAYTVEEPVSESVDLREERVELERRPVDRAAIVDEDFRDRTIEAEEHREEAVVAKDARVVEEIGLRKTSDSHRETISDTVRHTEVEIEDDRDERGLPKKTL